MTEHDAFLSAIRESPNDDGPRLMYADWLTEHGDAVDRAHAAYIKADCAYEPVRYGRGARARRLLHFSNDAWNKYRAALDVAEPSLSPTRFTVRHGSRGFVGSVQIRCGHDGFLEQLNAAFSRFGLLERLHLSSISPEQSETLFALPHIARVRTLVIDRTSESYYEQYDSERLISAMVNSPHASGIREIEFDRLPASDAAVTLLTDWRRAEEIRSLKWIGSRMEDSQAIALSNSGRLPNLQSLDLAANFISIEGIMAAIRSETLRALELDFSFNNATEHDVAQACLEAGMLLFNERGRWGWDRTYVMKNDQRVYINAQND